LLVIDVSSFVNHALNLLMFLCFRFLDVIL